MSRVTKQRRRVTILKGMDMLPAILIPIYIVAAFVFYHLYWKRRNLPAGPIPIPFVGNTISLNKSLRWELRFNEWRQRFGPIYTYWVGELPIVAINEHKLATKLFVGEADAFVDRCAPEHFLKYTRGGHVSGVIFTSGELWRDQRRFALRVLKDFGVGKNELQEKILEEIRAVIKNVTEDISAGVVDHDFHKHTDLAIGSVINQLIFGYRFTKANAVEFHRMKAKTTEIIRSFTDPIIGIGRFNKLFFDLTFPYGKKVIRAFEEVFRFLDSNVQRRRKRHQLVEAGQVADYLDAFLATQKRMDEENAGNGFYSDPQLMGMCFDLWFAGQETMSSTLTWMVAFLITDPESQRKAREEINSVVGDRWVVNADKPQLHFVNAVIAEGQRTANIFSQNVLREASRDIEIDGIRIPKGTCVIPQISAIHYDPTSPSASIRCVSSTPAENSKDPMP